MDGRNWRTTYSAPDNTKREGLDSIVWPGAFERMEQFIRDTGLSQDVDMQLTEYLKDVKPVIEENHMYIRMASNDFFSVSKDVVSKMISGEYDAEQDYQSFDTQLLDEKSTSENVVLNSKKSYSNRFHCDGGNDAYSVMANTLRGIYGSDVLIATGNSFTGNVLKAGYTEKMAGNMIMPNGLSAYSSKMSGAEQ